MKTLKTKAKTKKGGGKFGKVKVSPTKETQNTVNTDLSELRKPIDISTTNLYKIIKVFDNGTDEVKRVLAHECDIIYECRVCRSLFRSLVNFISHKRAYCTDKFNCGPVKNVANEYDMIINNGLFNNNEEPESSIADNSKNNRILRSQAKTVEKKDLTSVVDMLQKKQLENLQQSDSDISQNNNTEIIKIDNKSIVLEPISSNANVAYQTALEQTESPIFNNELMKNQVVELHNIINGNEGVLGPDGQLLEANTVNNKDNENNKNHLTSISDDDCNLNIDHFSMQNLICSLCNARFSTKKTLTFHVKTLHTTHRMCYPCPCCSSTFANTWSVYRHLFKVHRKSNDQVRKMRTQIQEKAFRRETTAAEDNYKNSELQRIASSTNLSMNNSAKDWIENQELDIELQRCGTCGKRFERKVALFSHSQNCQKRLAASNHLNSKDKASDKSSISSDKSFTSSTSGCNELPFTNESNSANDNVQNRLSERDTSTSPELEVETTIRVQAVGSLSKADWDKLDNENELSAVSKDLNPDTSSSSEVSRIQSSPSSEIYDFPEIIYTKVNAPETDTIILGSKKRKISRKKKISIAKKASISIEDKVEENMIVDTSSNESNALIDPLSNDAPNKIDYRAIMENRIANIINPRRLQCLLCKHKFTSRPNLRRHMAIHIGWNRYRCKLCNFKCFVKCECVAHCNKMHNAQNNRILLAEMVIQIPEEEYAYNQEIIMDINTVDEGEIEMIPETTSTTEMEVNPIEEEKTIEKHEDDANTEKVTVDEDALIVKEIAYPKPDNSPVRVKCEELDEVNETLNSTQETERPQSCILDTDADLRRMVMEVIFGSSETIKENNETESAAQENKTSVKKRTAKERKSSTSEANNTEAPKDTRPQRPVRNRVKPIDKDFIYDLKEKSRKETLCKANLLSSNKSMNKMPILQIESENKEYLPTETIVQLVDPLADEVHSPTSVYSREDSDVEMMNKCLNENLSISDLTKVDFVQAPNVLFCVNK